MTALQLSALLSISTLALAALWLWLVQTSRVTRLRYVVLLLGVALLPVCGALFLLFARHLVLADRGY